MSPYTTKEASEILGIKERAVQTKCKKEGVRKKDNKYLITDELIKTWKEQTQQTNAKANAKKDANAIINALQNQVKKLNEKLSEFKIQPNERMEVFTNDEYKIFETRLIEWKEQRQELIHQEQLFNVTNKSNEELIIHYKTQFEYQKKQNEKVLEMHQKLIDVIGEQNKIAIQKNIIEAIDKEVIKKDTWRKE